jgi:hypothetical protein
MRRSCPRIARVFNLLFRVPPLLNWNQLSRSSLIRSAAAILGPHPRCRAGIAVSAKPGLIPREPGFVFGDQRRRRLWASGSFKCGGICCSASSKGADDNTTSPVNGKSSRIAGTKIRTTTAAVRREHSQCPSGSNKRRSLNFGPRVFSPCADA